MAKQASLVAAFVLRDDRIIESVAPSEYLPKLEEENSTTPPIAAERLDKYLRSHFLKPALPRGDSFEGFAPNRQRRLLELIDRQWGNGRTSGEALEDDAYESDEPTLEAHLTIAAGSGFTSPHSLMRVCQISAAP
ncbi:hypothetical protein [Burkholderia sp. PAMC 26561]|uniref:hypothetical protein n=1 Tax=Burkholderia sp. PAMC 26561 TaxID=1795043 RepID=UPI00076B7EAB|nr:hypothetical protein [Burkholderia sp. PAMC 26561]AMH42761.1 hypothetical protein AXG89_33945 [Burkholderia sp. PAMC 26561]